MASLAVLGASPAHATPSGSRCVITGNEVTLTGLIVQTRAGSFQVSIQGRPAKVIAHGDTVDIEVDGAIAFKATVKRKIWYALQNGIFRDNLLLSSSAQFIADRAEGNELIGSAVVRSNDVLAGEDKEPDQVVSSIRVPCGELTLDWGFTAGPVVAGDGTRWFARTGSSLTLHADPDDRSPVVRVAALHCDDCMMDVEGIAHRGAWRKVAVSGSGVVATGWVRTRLLERIPDSMGLARGVSCTGDHGGTMDTLYPPGTKKRSARLKAGTPIYGGRGGTGQAWATVSQEQVFEVMYVDGAAWADLIIPGVTLGDGASAYVRVSALIFES